MKQFIYLETKYGIYKVRKDRLNHKPTIKSYLDKNDFYKKLLKEKQPVLYEKIEIISDISSLKDYILIKNKYGICKISATNLLCGYEPSIISAVDKKDYFVNQAKEIHGNKYDYSEVEYINYKHKIKIFCNKCCNYFYQSSSNHLQGQDCCCMKIQKIKDKQTKLSKEEFSTKASLIHDYKYDYSLVNYVNAKTKIEIICPIHGSFFQEPNSHLSKCGCKKCSDALSSYYWTSKVWEEKSKISKEFDSFKFYIIRCWCENENFYKIGKTYKKISKRFYKNNFPYNYEIVQIIEGTSDEITKLEIQFKQTFKNFNYRPKIKFGGASECYTKYE